MNENEILPDDPRLTAYALGELDPTEQAEVERLLADSPAAQTALVEIRGVAGLLANELRQEPVLALTSAQRAAVLEGNVPTIARRSAIASRKAAPRLMWFASLATIASLFVVTALVLPTANPPDDRFSHLLSESEAARWQELTGINGITESLDDLRQSGDLNDEQQQIAVDKLRTAVRNAEFRAERLARVDPQLALEIVEKAQISVENSGLEAPISERLLKSLAKSRDNIEYYRTNSSPMIEMANRKKEVEETIRREEQTRTGPTYDFSEKVEKYNDLLKQKRFDDAIIVSNEVRQLQPDNPVAEVMLYKAKLARQDDLNRKNRERNADMFTMQLNDVSEESAPRSDLTADGSVPNRANSKLNIVAGRKEGEKYDPSHGNGQRGQGLYSGIGNRIAVNASGNERADSKPAGGPQSYNRPTSTSTESAKQSVQKGSVKRHGRLNADLAQKAPAETGPVSGEGRSEGIDNGKHSAGKSGSSSSQGGARPNPDAGFKASGGGGGYGGGSAPQPAGDREAKADKFTKQLSDLDESAEGYVADLEYPDDKKWQALERRRQKFKKEKDGDRIAGESEYIRGFQTLSTNSFELAEDHRRKLTESLLGTEAYEPIIENSFRSSYEDPLSTFGIDVDTASYANVRRFLTQQLLPPPNAVRIEELVNYFSYDYPQPAGDQPFSVNVEAGRCPWNTGNGLVRIGLKGREIDRDKRPASNLVFLVDVSGSMQAENKLPLVKMGLNLLTQQMTESDRVAIVTYSDTAVQRLESTNGTNKPAIVGVINSLQAGGSTNGAGGIQLAYRAALEHFVAGGTNRVILCTDGDFNVGVTGDDELVKMIEERARIKVFFSVLGFGMGNLKDGKLEKLADKGNGQYAYIDSQREAKKVFVDDLAGTLVTIAKDVKIQVEFNPNQVGAYRLIGYENRVMASQDFNNDAKDAGDIGAGHSVTALYEILPAGEAPRPELGDSLRYRKAVVPQEGGLARELLTVKLRYKLPEADKSTLVEVPIDDPRALPVSGLGNLAPAAARKPTSPDFNWATAVAAFGMILRDSQFRGQASFDMVLELAQGAKGEDKAGRRQEFIELVKAAKALYGGGSPATGVLPVEPQAVPALTREQAEAKATVNGKYKNLLRIVEAPGDSSAYGTFHEYGRWEGTSYRDQNNLPVGYWVYVAPNWYIWGDYAQRE